MWRLAKHSRETVPTGVHPPGVAAILKQTTLDPRHGTTAPAEWARIFKTHAVVYLSTAVKSLNYSSCVLWLYSA